MIAAVIGGWDNTRTILRKRINGVVLDDVFWPNLLSEHKRSKFIIEISTIGDIKLYAEEDLYHPIVHAFDGNPLAVQYMSIKNYKKEHIELFYGMKRPAVKDLLMIEEEYGDYKEHPVLRTYKKLSNKLTVPLLWQHSNYYESWSTAYTKFMKIDQSWPKPDDMRLQFPVIVQGTRDVRILLSPTQTPDALDENVYEIRVGDNGNSLTPYGRKIDSYIMSEEFEQNILSPNGLTMLLVEVWNMGRICIWSSHNPYVPILSVVDPKALDVKYISFASSSRMQLFYDFSLDALEHILPSDDVLPIVYNEHPLLVRKDYPIGVSNLCKNFQANRVIPRF